MKKTIKGFMIGLLAGTLLMATTSSFASIKEYILVPAIYPIVVNETVYQGHMPMLNYQGHTYVPLRATSDLLGTHIYWNEDLRQVEITFGEPALENQAFRNIMVSGSHGNYTVAGQARVYEGTVQYEVEDGHFILDEGFTTASEGGPGWGIFKIDIQIPPEDLPEYGSVRIVLFEESAEDGSRLHEIAVLLEDFN